MRAIVIAALAYTALARVFELTRSRRNESRLALRGARRVPGDGLGAIVAVHALWFVSIAVEELALGPTLTSPALRWSFATGVVVAELTRSWCMRSLGDRWCVRVVVVDGEAPVRDGPYRWSRNPNYVTAALGLACLPLALGLVWTTVATLPLKVLALSRRIRVEEEALAAAASATA